MSWRGSAVLRGREGSEVIGDVTEDPDEEREMISESGLSAITE